MDLTTKKGYNNYVAIATFSFTPSFGAQFESYHGTGDDRVVKSNHDYFNLQR